MTSSSPSRLLALAALARGACASLRMLPQLNLVGAVTVSGISSGADAAVQFHIAHSDIVNGSAVFAGQAYGCAVMRFDGEPQVPCSAMPSGPGCAGMPWGPAPCVGCDAGMTLAIDHCKQQPNLTAAPGAIAKLASYARAAEAAGDIPPLASLAFSNVFLFRGTLDTGVRDGCVNATMQTFAALGVPTSHMLFNSNVPAAHCWPTADAAVPASSCGGGRGGPPWMENCGFDGAGAALQQLYGGSLTPPQNLSAFDPGNLLMFYQFHYEQDTPWAGQGKQGWLYRPQRCQQGHPCTLHVALHGCGMSASNPSMGMSFVMHTGLNSWADANDIVVLYPQQGGFRDYNLTAPTAQLGAACFDGYGQTGVDYAQFTSPQMLAIRNMISAMRGGNLDSDGRLAHAFRPRPRRGAAELPEHPACAEHAEACRRRRQGA